jgi:HlyD family secretion protein
MGSQKRIKVFLLVAFALIALAAIGYYSRLFVPNTVKPGSFTTEIVDRGQVISATDAIGIVESENEVLVLSPGTGIIQSILAEPGSRIKKGDLILQLNTDAVKDDIENITDQLEVRRNSLKRTRLNAQSTRLDLEYNEEVKKLRIANLESQLADQEQLLEVGGISPARLDQTKQEITLAEKDLKTLVEKNSIRLQQLEAEEQGLLLQIGMQEKTLEERKQLLEKMSIRAPSDGIILTINGQVGEKVGTDNLLVRLSDLTSFKVSGSVEEQHAKQLKTGNQVIIMVDGEQLEGTVGNITPRVENNKVQFNVHLEQSSHPKLIANQQVQIQIINSLKNNTLRLKKIPDFDNSKKQKKFVVEGDKAIQKEFSLGIIGNEYCEILSGLNEGDIVVTEGLNAFRHMNEIEIQK